MFKHTFERASASELTFFMSITCVLVIMFFFKNYLQMVYVAFRLPGPKAYPFVGNSLLATKSKMIVHELERCYDNYGPISRVWFAFLPFFIISEPEHLQIILGSSKHVEKSFLYSLLHNFLGDGLITSSGEKWFYHRKYIQPTFHLSILEHFIKTFTASSTCLKNKIKTNEAVNITRIINECVLDILNESVLGVLIGDKSEIENSPFRRGKVILGERVASPWLLFSSIYKLTKAANEELKQKNELNIFTRKIIQNRRLEKLSGRLFERKSLLDYMLDISENHKDFTDDDIVNEACTFMLAGQDSVGASLAFCFFLLAQYPDHQAKCIAEIDDIFSSDRERSPSMSDLKHMKHLEMCIKETMRLYPAVPMIMRKLANDVSFGKRTLPAGSEIFILPYVTHRLKHVYPDPEKFMPERFSSANCEKRNPYSFIPFSAGPRNCIGYKFAMMEMKTVLSSILRNYKILPVPGKTTITPIFRVTLRAKGGLWVKFEPRSDE